MAPTARFTEPRVAGLDLSLTGTGIAVVGPAWGGDPSKVTSIRVSVPGDGKLDADRVRRCTSIAEVIVNVLREQRVSHVFVESYAFGVAQQATRAFALGELGGIVRYVLRRELHLDTISVTASSARKILLGSGRAKKPDVIAALARIGWARSHDEGDALAVANYGLSELGFTAVTL